MTSKSVAKPLTREELVTKILDERVRQEEELYEPEFDDFNTANDWATHICAYATTPMGSENITAFKDAMIVVAALALAALEAAERGGPYPRHYD